MHAVCVLFTESISHADPKNTKKMTDSLSNLYVRSQCLEIDGKANSLASVLAKLKGTRKELSAIVCEHNGQ